MSKFREKAEAQTEQVIGQMLGDELLVREGQERLRSAEMESGDRRQRPAQDETRSGSMQKENDLEGAWDQGGKHGGQQGMPRPEPRPESSPEQHRAKDADQGIVRDERGQEQPRDKARAQQVSRVDKGGDPPGKRAS
jgi:hypothetical protein